MANCSSCGREIGAEMLFCPYCGSRQPLDHEGRPIETGPEKPIGLIPDVVVSSATFEVGHYTLILFPKKVLFAIMGEEDIRSYSGVSSPAPFRAGLISKEDPEAGPSLGYASRYWDMREEDVMKESVGNQTLRNDHVERVELSMKEGSSNRYRVRLSTSSGMIDMDLPVQHDHRKLLLHQYEGKVRW